jgi:hypothetical protein
MHDKTSSHDTAQDKATLDTTTLLAQPVHVFPLIERSWVCNALTEVPVDVLEVCGVSNATSTEAFGHQTRHS